MTLEYEPFDRLGRNKEATLKELRFFKDTANSGLALGVITIDTIKEKFNVCVDNRSANKIYEKVHEVLLSIVIILKVSFKLKSS